MLFFKKVMLYLLISLPSFYSFAFTEDESVAVGSYLVPGMVQVDGNGMFDKLNALVFSKIDTSYTLVTEPIHRIRKSLKDGHVDTYFPELWENLPGEKSDYVISSPIFYKKIILFTLNNSGIYSLKDLESLLVGAVSGFSYGTDIIENPNLNILYQRDDSINIRLLANGRLDGVLGGFPGTVIAVNNSEYKHRIQYDLTKPVAVLESFYVCPNTPAGRVLCDKISRGIEALQADGILLLDHTTGSSKFNPPKNIDGSL